MVGLGAVAAERLTIDDDPARYAATPATGALADLQQRLERGTAKLEYSAEFGFLPALLRELKILPESQLLVASKTSPNKDLISPRNPRALYYNDHVSVAFVPGASLIELAAQDARLGSVFYTLDQHLVEHPKLVRDNRCLECHSSSKTLQVPGWMVRSFATHADGEVDVLGGLMVTHRTPIAERWGGYYVTGTLGGQPHRGNRFDTGTAPAAATTGMELAAFPDATKKFPTPSSDVAALMVFEHQVHMMNLLARYRAEVDALKESDPLDRAHPSAEAVLQYMLFADEARLAAPVKGSSNFAQAFEAQGPKDARGRSLRDLDLNQRLFVYPCSFMIYSPSFDALPLRARRHLYRRLWNILTGAEPAPGPRLAEPEARATIRDILLETKKDLPVYWRLP